MSINFQVLVLKKLASFFLFAVNVFGLWPFKFVQRNSLVKYTYLRAIYSALVLCLGSSTHWIVGEYVFRIIRKKHFNSFTLKLVTSCHGYSLLTIFLIVYIRLHLNARKIEIVYRKCKGIFDVMNEFYSRKRIGIRVYLLGIIMKTVVFDFIISILSLQSYNHSTDIMQHKIFFLLLLPPIAVRLYMNIFYSALLVIEVYLKVLNGSLNDIVTEAKIVRSENRSMDKFLSDQVDEIALIYFRLTEATKSINSIFSVNITINLALHLITLTIQSLMIFVEIKELFRQGTDFVTVQNILFGCCSLILTFYDVFTTAYAAERLVREVCN